MDRNVIFSQLYISFCFDWWLTSTLDICVWYCNRLWKYLMDDIYSKNIMLLVHWSTPKCQSPNSDLTGCTDCNHLLITWHFNTRLQSLLETFFVFFLISCITMECMSLWTFNCHQSFESCISLTLDQIQGGKECCCFDVIFTFLITRIYLNEDVCIFLEYLRLVFWSHLHAPCYAPYLSRSRWEDGEEGVYVGWMYSSDGDVNEWYGGSGFALTMNVWMWFFVKDILNEFMVRMWVDDGDMDMIDDWVWCGVCECIWGIVVIVRWCRISGDWDVHVKTWDICWEWWKRDLMEGEGNGWG